MRYAPEDWNRLQTLFTELGSWNKVIKATGVSPTTLAKAKRQGLLEGSCPRIDEREARKLYESGLSLKRVAKQMQTTLGRVRAVITVTRSHSQARPLRQKTKPTFSKAVRQQMSERMKARHSKGIAYTLGHNRSKQEPSYPEKWWKTFIDGEINDKNYVAEYRFHRYSLDFAWPNKKIALEIDGEQHYRFQNQIESDKRRDQILMEAGWKVLRIRWSECVRNSEPFKDAVKNLVDGGCSSTS